MGVGTFSSDQSLWADVTRFTSHTNLPGGKFLFCFVWQTTLLVVAYPHSQTTLNHAMASLSRTFVSIANRSYVNAPAAAPAMAKVLGVSAGVPSDHHGEHIGKPLLGASTKQRSSGGLLSRTAVNSKYRTYESLTTSLRSCQGMPGHGNCA